MDAMKRRSSVMTEGVQRSPHRSLMKALGWTDREIHLPIIGIVSGANEIIPGHIHLDRIVNGVKAGVRQAGGNPVSFPVIGVCDGIAMGHTGMRYSLASRELIADSIEVMAMAHLFDALVFVPNCDKLSRDAHGTARLNIPHLVSGGLMLAGTMDTHDAQDQPPACSRGRRLRPPSSRTKSCSNMRTTPSHLWACSMYITA